MLQTRLVVVVVPRLRNHRDEQGEGLGELDDWSELVQDRDASLYELRLRTRIMSTYNWIACKSCLEGVLRASDARVVQHRASKVQHHRDKRRIATAAGKTGTKSVEPNREDVLRVHRLLNEALPLFQGVPVAVGWVGLFKC